MRTTISPCFYKINVVIYIRALLHRLGEYGAARDGRGVEGQYVMDKVLWARPGVLASTEAKSD